MVANPTRGQLNRENEFSQYAFAPENFASRDGFGSLVPRQRAHLYTQAESSAYWRIPPEFRGGVHLFFLRPPYAIGSVPSLSGHVIAYRWRSLSRYFQHAITTSYQLWVWER